MIIYDKSAFGLNLLFRVHGSAVYRSVIPGLVSIGFLILFRYLRTQRAESDGRFNGDGAVEDMIDHPYSVGVLISSTTFLIVFRANNAYSRYWEAAGAVHHFMSKVMDATTHMAVFHMQCDHYDKIKPPSYYDHHDLNAMFLTRARERVSVTARTGRASLMKAQNRAFTKSINALGALDRITADAFGTASKASNTPSEVEGRSPRVLQGRAKLDGNWGELFDDGTSTYFSPKLREPNFMNVRSSSSHMPVSGTTTSSSTANASDAIIDPPKLPSFASLQGGRTPALFLQELSHLASLLCAVALSTLRNDIDGSQSPLGMYEAGSPWPEVDSDKIVDFNHSLFDNLWYKRIWARFLYLLGAGKTPQERTRYNAARPLPVIGGVSDNEILFLQMARGPYAKTVLCWNWLSEFMIREHLAGSTGNVGPPIISRLVQFLSDGMIYYNHARKIMFIPFPFPHAQLSSLFIFCSIPAIAFLMEQFSDNLFIASALSFLSVACLSGIHEVARELENPFRNIPNELPVVTFQAQFNEALITMYSGYHPDHFWDASEYKYSFPQPSPTFPPTNPTTTKSSTMKPNLQTTPESPELNESSDDEPTMEPIDAPSTPPETPPPESPPPESVPKEKST